MKLVIDTRSSDGHQLMTIAYNYVSVYWPDRFCTEIGEF